jgi:hypothetical protein
MRTWRDVAVRTGVLLVRFYARADLLVGAITLVGGAGIVALLRLVPWWGVLIGLVLLVLYAFAIAVFDKIRETEDGKAALEGKLSTAKKRRAVKDLLGVAVEQGEDLRVTLRKEGDSFRFVSKQDVEEWVHRTRDLIEAAFDKGEARRFLDSSDYKPEKPLPYREIRSEPYKYHLTPRLQRLNELILRANTLEINPDFEPQRFAQSAEESAAARLRLEAVAEQRNEENEKLKADIAHLAVERDALEQDSRTFTAELDGQIRGRCIELTDELDGFLTLNRAMPPEETMRLYGEQLRGKVDRLRADLMRLGWWKPREDVKRELEYPETPDHLLSIYHYVRNIGLDMPFK